MSGEQNKRRLFACGIVARRRLRHSINTPVDVVGDVGGGVTTRKVFAGEIDGAKLVIRHLTEDVPLYV
jgi:hypothetical protein